MTRDSSRTSQPESLLSPPALQPPHTASGRAKNGRVTDVEMKC